MTSTSGNAGRADQGIDNARRSRPVDWRRDQKKLTASLIDIDIVLTGIVFQRCGDGLDGLGVGRPSSLVDYAIEGFVRPAASGTADDDASDSFLVYLSGYNRMDWNEDIDQRSVCYIATDRRPDHEWRTDIYIERRIFRLLVELYASKRIDAARISILLKVLRDSSGAVDVPTTRHPLLRTAGDRHRQYSRANLMSVQTSLGAARRVHPSAVAAHPTALGACMARRRDVALRP